jgi:hypothetical protein
MAFPPASPYGLGLTSLNFADAVSIAFADWHRQLGGTRNLLVCDIGWLEEAFMRAGSNEERSYILAIFEIRAGYLPYAGDYSQDGPHQLFCETSFGAMLLISCNTKHGVFLAQAASEKVGGILGPWKYLSTWAYSQLSVGSVVIDVGVSTAGVVHINENPFSPLMRRTNVTLNAIIASINAVLDGTAVDVRPGSRIAQNS